ncbi:MAG: NUDIX hydrolase [Actinocatenispora sp.]
MAHARRFYAEGGTPAVPRRAATVVLLRDTADGMQAYLVRRATTMAFASGMYAFPGGSIDARDETTGGDDAPWASWVELLGLADPNGPGGADDLGVAQARAVLCAAVRETFEEAGVLLAGPDPDALVGNVDTEDWEADRESLVAHRTGLSELLAARGLLLRTDLLRPWARWITPEFEPRRYDTFFFVAELPAGQVARQVGGEADRVLWMPPGEAVAEQAAGRMAMLPPTVAVLSALSGYATVADALGAATRPLVPVTPQIRLSGSGGRLVFPDGA